MTNNIKNISGTMPDFHCRVPLSDIQPLLLVNGVCRNIDSLNMANITATPCDGGMGVALTVAAGTEPKQFTQIINTRYSDNIQPLKFSNSFIIESQAKVKLIVCDHTLSPDAFTTVCETDITVCDGAHLELLWVQSEHNRSLHQSKICIRQATGSKVACNVVTLHGAVTENIIEIKLQGKHADCQINGLFLIDGEQHYTTNITVLHEAENCYSNQLFKGILDNRAVGYFHGRVFVARGAQKAEAYQTNNNLLLTKKAKMYSQPQLEIYADDVKCSHGATIGQLDEDALFYLRSRGITLKAAQFLQQIGFVQDVLDKINIVPLRERIVELIEKRLQGKFSQCTDCYIHCC